MVITKGWNPTRKLRLLEKGTEDKGESSHYPSYRRTVTPYRAYSDSFRLTRSRPNQLSNGFTPFRNQQISGQESPFFTISGSFQEKKRKQGQAQTFLQPEEERVRPLIQKLLDLEKEVHKNQK
ncbi:hypothetical protein O181_091643 [Austropuccinia psidii MF-1]|uniref:Uncharacterized protein n=1 Tax=Austropuccinia psidii MF-1 TaxID=1389203 RepID=A0A9Q3P7P6_9BASI|nr:hypothetical protein [Austropuccinia psidii MF-1]